MAMFLAVILCLSLAAGTFGEEESKIKNILFKAENRGFGKEAVSVILTLESTEEYKALTKEDYSFNRVMIDKRTGKETDMHPLSVQYTDTEIILETEPFIVESSKRHFSFTCTDERLNFIYADITEISCPNVDLFTDEEEIVGEYTMKYHLYTPEAEEPVPVVVYNHGGGCTGYEGVLTDDCFASAWITGNAQKEFPCYVIASYRASLKDAAVSQKTEMEALKAAIDRLVESGKVDGNRIYMCGESAGCMFTRAFGAAYPGYLAAEVLMSGGPMDIAEDAVLEEAMQKNLASPWSDKDLQTLAASGTAVAVVQGIGDTLSFPIRLATAYKKMEALGMNVIWISYNAEEFNELLRSVTAIYHIGKDEPEKAFDPITGKETWQEGLFHNTSRVAAWDPTLRAWLRDRSKTIKLELNELEDREKTILPNQNNSKNDVMGSVPYMEIPLTIDYNGIELAATLSMPESDGLVPLVLMGHGYTGSQNHFTQYAEVYASNGVASIRFDFPANGKSSGKSTDISLLTEKEVMSFMLDYARTLEGIDPDNIYLSGQSMGGMVAALCGAERLNDIQGLILYYPGFPIPQFTREGNVLGTEFNPENVPDTIEIYHYTVGSIFITDAFDIDVYGEVLPSIQKDVLIFHGTKDDMIDLQYSEKALEALPSARLVIVEGYGHGFPGFVLADIMPYALDFVASRGFTLSELW